MAEQGLQIAVIGATGAVGKDLLEVLDAGGLPVSGLDLFAGPGSTAQRVEVGDRSHIIRALPPDPLESPVFDDVELVFLAATPDVARDLGPVFSERGIATVEIGGALAGQAPMAVAEVADEALEHFSRTRVVSTPSGAAVMLTHVLAPVYDLGLVGCRGTLMLPASTAGKAGLDELSQQVVALFNSQDPPRSIFPHGLAFDVITRLGEGAGGWSPGELRVAAEVGTLVGLEPERVAITTMVGPWFSGMMASLQLEFAVEPELETLQQSWQGTPFVKLGEPVPGPRRVVGTGDLLLGRLRSDPTGAGVHLVAVADNLRHGASLAAIRVARRLLDEGLV